MVIQRTPPAKTLKKIIKRPETSEAEPVSSAANGFAVSRELAQQNKKIKEMYEHRPPEFFLKEGTEANIILIDIEPFFMYRHSTFINGKVKHYPCLKDSTEHFCPACRSLDQNSTFTMMVGCIDLRPYKDKDGKVTKFSRRIMAVKQSMHPAYERLFKGNGNSFRGIELGIYRDGPKDPSTGNQIEKQGVLTDKQLLATYAKLADPIDYDKAFPLVTPEELERMLAHQPSGGGFNKYSAKDDEDDSSSYTSNVSFKRNT